MLRACFSAPISMRATCADDEQPRHEPLLQDHLLAHIGNLTRHWARVSNRICAVISRHAPPGTAAGPCDRQQVSRHAFRNGSSLSVIIPALNEEARIAAAIRSADIGDKGCKQPEIIVIDGGSHDDTVKTAKRCGAKVIRSGAGRGRQMNAGATSATGDWLLFLHGDSQLPPDYMAAMQRAFSSSKHVPTWGCFESIQLDEKTPRAWLLRHLVGWRTHLRHLPYGDQAIFVDRATFKEVGGFKEWRLLEDVDLVQRLRAAGGRPAIVRRRVTVSARRWQRLGLLHTFLVNQYILTAWRLGADPDALADKYHAVGGGDTSRNEGDGRTRKA